MVVVLEVLMMGMRTAAAGCGGGDRGMLIMDTLSPLLPSLEMIWVEMR